MFDDKRSKKVVIVSHCVLNQNTKLDRCAHFSGAVTNIVELLISNGIGIIQAPCPEMLYLGLNRGAAIDSTPSVEEEDTRIAREMWSANGIHLCCEIAQNLIDQVEDYRRNGFTVLGMIGINGSPTCGVETTWIEGKEIEGMGVLIQQLVLELSRKNISFPINGIKVYQPELAEEVVRFMLG